MYALVGRLPPKQQEAPHSRQSGGWTYRPMIQTAYRTNAVLISVDDLMVGEVGSVSIVKSF